MSAKILDGKALAEKYFFDISQEIKRYDLKPKLRVITIGDDKASQVYVRNKKRACEQCGIEFEHVTFNEHESHFYIDTYVFTQCNECPTILQLPIHHDDPNLSKRLSIFFQKELKPEYDADGFGNDTSLALYLNSNAEHYPCTPLGICKLLETIPNFSYEGKHVVVVGRSNIVGKPLALMLMNKNCTVTMCHSKTQNLPELTRSADILISAVGKRHLITKDMVREQTIVIDVGMNRDEDNHLCGDVDFEDVRDIASYITPVPEGVGPMTVAMLMYNVVECYKKKEGIK